MTTKLITREGFTQLESELAFLWKDERPKITEKVTWAAGLGDRSENADYQYNKKRLREIDRRVRYLTKVLDQLTIIDYHSQQEGRVFFGAWVCCQKQASSDTRKITFRIVGSEEIYGREDYVSIDSPMAQSCLKHQVDDIVSVSTPKGKVDWKILNISYHKDSLLI